MLNFSNTVPIEATRFAMRLARTPAKGKLHLVVTSADLLGCFTHFFSGRTTPCTGKACEACEAGASSRWHAYLSALDPATSEHILFECTAAAAETFADYRARHGSLRGCEFIATRVNPRPNARVSIRTKPADLAHLHLPEPANLPAALCHIWGIPLNETNTSDRDLSTPNIDHIGTLPPPDKGNGQAPAPSTPAPTLPTRR